MARIAPVQYHCPNQWTQDLSSLVHVINFQAEAVYKINLNLTHGFIPRHPLVKRRICYHVLFGIIDIDGIEGQLFFLAHFRLG